MPKVFFDLYGFATDDLDFMVEPLELILGIKSVARTSDYIGDHNTFDGENGESFDLRTNIDGEGELVKPQHKDMGLLLFVSRTQRADQLRELLTNNFSDIVFLESKVFQD